MEFVEQVEGETRLLVPAASLTVDPPPTTPIFFNPAAALNRDITVAVTSATGGRSFCDSMAGVGARGVRVAHEIARVESVSMVDLNSGALDSARKSAALNGVAGKCTFSNSETSAYLASRAGRDQGFDCVDVDPFGTPVRYLQAALGAASDRGIVSITATDTAVLCGVYPRVSERRYGATSVNNDFHHETGIRILVGALARQGAQVDLGVEPVFAHSTRHYIRIFVMVTAGTSAADQTLERLGHIVWCPGCRRTQTAEVGLGTCPDCGRKVRVAGPLWLHGLTRSEVLAAAARSASKKGLDRAADLIESTTGIDDYPPWSFSIEQASSTLRVATPPESSVSRELSKMGRRAMRTPFEKTGIKTDAPYDEFLQATAGANAGARIQDEREPQR